MSVVWCLSPEHAKTLSTASDDELIEKLQTQFGYRLGRIVSVGARITCPLIRREAVKQVGERTVLLGNAVRLLHPVAGQGFNLALRDTAVLLDCMGQKTESRFVDPGSHDVLKSFVDARARDQNQVVTLTDTLARTFRGNAKFPGHVRALALAGMDGIGPLRDQFAQRTMGYTG